MKSSQAQKLIQRSALPVAALFSARTSVSPREYQQLFRLVLSSRSNGKPLLSAYTSLLRPIRWSQLGDSKFPRSLSFERNLAWAEAILCSYASAISQFVEHSESHERLLLTNQVAEAERALVEIEKTHGCSLWLLQATVHFKQTFKGLEDQKNYVSGVRRQLNNPTAFLANAYSHRNEADTSVISFNETIASRIQHLEEGGFRSWILYWATAKRPRTIDELNGILTLNAILPLIDQYESIIDLLPHAHQYTSIYESRELVGLARTLARSISDSRLKRYLAAEDDGASVAWQSLRTIEDLPSTLDLAISAGAWGQSITSSNSAGPRVGGRQISSLLETLYQQGAHPKLRSELEKISQNAQHLRVSRVIAFLLNRELDPEPISKTSLALSAFINDTSSGKLTAPYLPSPYNPPLAQSSGSEMVDQVANIRSGVVGLEQPSHEISNNSLILAAAEHEVRAQQPDLALIYISTLNLADTARDWRLCQRVKCAAYINSGEIYLALKTAVDAGLKDQGVLPLLPWTAIAERTDDNLRSQNAKSVHIPVFYHFCASQGLNLRERELDYSYEDFLMANNISRPTQLRQIYDGLPSDALELYLREVCVPDIMRISTAFGNSEELLEERAAICAWLADTNPRRAPIYQEEISEITRTLAIRAAVRHVEQSKISLDEPALRKWCQENLTESLSRYMAMQEAGLSPKADAQQLLEESSSSTSGSDELLLQVPTDESGQLLINIMKRFFREATVNPEIGLNCFLSMRVRHGALAGQLRSPVEQQNIVTQRASDAGPYKSNQYWLDHYSTRSSAEQHAIEEALRFFSERYDSLISELNLKYIQISTPENTSGLFQLRISAVDVQLLMSKIRSDTTSDELFRALLSTYKDCLSDTLKEVRLHIDTKYRSAVTELFRNLQDDLSAIASNYPLYELLDAIKHAHTNAQHAIFGLLDWFQPPQPASRARFSFEELIRIGLQCIQRRHPNFSPALEVETPNDITTYSLVLFSDILTIVFDNIRIHSGNPTDPNVRIAIAIDNDKLFITVNSNICENVDVASLEARIAQARGLIASGDAERISKEGRSGFIKLKRLIGRNGTLDFGIMGNHTFEVSLAMPMKVLSYEDADS